MSEWAARPCRPEDIPHWAEFLDQNFQYEDPHSYRVDFAPFFTAEALKSSRLVWQNGKIVASASLHPLIAITPSIRLRLGIIGAVATDAACRGQGLCSTLLRELEDEARSKGMSGLLLWSDQNEFYLRMGYASIGKQRIYPAKALPRPLKIPAGAPLYGWDRGQVKRLYEQHALRAERADSYWEAIEAIKSCTRVQWLAPTGHVTAYLGFDRGHDMQGIVHEWGGDAESLHALLWIVLQSRPELSWLTHPLLDDPIKDLLGGAACHESAFGFYKPLGSAAARETLDQLWLWGLDSL